MNARHDQHPEADQKDWTWVLDEACPECGFDTRAPERADLAALARQVGRQWVEAIDDIEDPGARPAPTVWSPLEYACHVRDVYTLAYYRVRLMLDEEDPLFANWDQDATAIDDDYSSQDPAQVAVDLGTAAEEYATLLEHVPDDAWGRRGRRGDGASFTVESFVRYLVHDPIHHLTDVTGRRWE